MKSRLVATLACALVLPLGSFARAQDPIGLSGKALPYDQIRLTTADPRKGTNTSLVVTKDGHYTLDAGGHHLEGTLTANPWYAIAASASHATFSTDDGKSVGTSVGTTSFQLYAVSGARTFAVHGSADAPDLGSFGTLLGSLQDATRALTGAKPPFRLFGGDPKPPAALEVTFSKKDGSSPKEVVIQDDGSVTIKPATGPAETATMTPAESLAVAKAVRAVDRSGFIGDVPAYVSGSADLDRFKIVTYETLHEYLLTGYVGAYGEQDAVGALVVAVRSIVDRVETAPAVDPTKADPTKADTRKEGGVLSSFLDSVSRAVSGLFATPDAKPGLAPPPTDRGGRPPSTRGLAGVLGERVREATDATDGRDADRR
jgi:hypothetical protein